MITTSNPTQYNTKVLQFVKCSSEYWEFVRELRNDERVQHGFIERLEITKEQQIKYMNRFQDHYFICLLNGQPAGYVGVIEGDIRICTSPKFQSQGIGSFMLEEIMKVFPDAFGKVKIDNIASKKMFEKLGFKETFIIYTRQKTSTSN